MPLGVGRHRLQSILLWISLSTGLAVSLFTVIEEFCLATACRDTTAFTFFGFNMGLLGIAYFSLILIFLWLSKSFYWADMALAAMVFSGLGAELRLLWIQKYIIGSWCPLCVTICVALFFSATVLTAGRLKMAESRQVICAISVSWFAIMAMMTAAGLVIAAVGVKALT